MTTTTPPAGYDDDPAPFCGYLGGGRSAAPHGLADDCPDGIPPPTPSGGDGAGRPMFEWLPCAGEPGLRSHPDPTTTA